MGPSAVLAPRTGCELFRTDPAACVSNWAHQSRSSITVLLTGGQTPSPVESSSALSRPKQTQRPSTTLSKHLTGYQHGIDPDYNGLTTGNGQPRCWQAIVRVPRQRADGFGGGWLAATTVSPKTRSIDVAVTQWVKTLLCLLLVAWLLVATRTCRALMPNTTAGGEHQQHADVVRRASSHLSLLLLCNAHSAATGRWCRLQVARSTDAPFQGGQLSC